MAPEKEKTDAPASGGMAQNGDTCVDTSAQPGAIMTYDDLLKNLGEFGWFQKTRCFLLCLFGIVSAWHALNMVFIGKSVAHHCSVEFLLTANTSALGGLDETELKQTLLPVDKEGTADQCTMYDLAETEELWRDLGSNLSVWPSNRTTVPCSHGYSYPNDRSSSIVSEFDLVCGQSFMKSTSKTIFFVGRLCGALFFGQMADKFGRRPMFFVGIALLLVAGGVAAAAHSVFLFLPMYFLQGAGHTGVFLVAFTMVTELVGARYRVLTGFVIQMFYSLGYMSLAGLAFALQQWRHLEAAITVPVVLFVSYWWLLPESVRWLLSQDRDEEAERILRHVAKANKSVFPEGTTQALKASKEKEVTSQRQHHILDLLRTWTMARLTLNVWFNWMVNALVYYGLSLNTENLAGDPYLNFCIAGAVEIPAYLLCILVLNRVGRRIPLVVSMVIGGVACIVSGCLPNQDDPSMMTTAVVLAMVGKFCITASYAIIYLMAAEVFPTVVRNVGVGTSSMSARIGGILAPVILDLKVLFAPLPVIVFGALSVLAGCLALLLPETAHRALPQTLEDVQSHGGCSCFAKSYSPQHRTESEMTEKA